jgi:hypothetical protein
VQIWIVLVVMIAAFAFAKRKLSVETSMLASAVAGALASAVFATPPIGRVAYHLVNGSLAYLDVVMIFVAATFLMEVISVSGGANWVVVTIVRRFGGNRALTLLLLMLVMLIPGALTGVGTTALVMFGGPVAAVLAALGMSKRNVAGMLFVLASLGAVAPPVNLWAMIGCAGAAIPYVGFELSLGLPALVLGLFTLLVFGRGTQALEKDKMLASLPEVVEGTTWWRVLTPFAVLILLMVAYRIWPFHMPTLGLPLQFAIAGGVAWVLAKKRPSLLSVSKDAIERVLPLIGTTIAVGMLQEIMSATGVRGLLSFGLLSLPTAVLLALLPVTMPVAGGLLAFGVAAVFGVPLMWLFQFHAMNLTVALSGLTLLWALGTALPPTAVIGRFTVLVTQYKEPYTRFLTGMWLPWLAMTAVGTLMVVFSTKLGFLFG